jgi:hypothetical protein
MQPHAGVADVHAFVAQEHADAAQDRVYGCRASKCVVSVCACCCRDAPPPEAAPAAARAATLLATPVAPAQVCWTCMVQATLLCPTQQRGTGNMGVRPAS